MAEVFLDRLADDTIAPLKGFFTHRIDDGEDPTTCMQMFLNFLESNKDKNPHFFQKIVSRIDSSFFAPLGKADQIVSPDDFVATYHNLVNKLIEVNPGMPYKADYERQKTLIDNAKDRIRNKVLTEKKAKKRVIDSQYNRILSEEKADYRAIGRGRELRIGWICAFVLLAISLLPVFLARPGSAMSNLLNGGLIVLLVVAPMIPVGFIISLFTEDRVICVGGGFWIGVGVGALIIYFYPITAVVSGVAGIVLLVLYKLEEIKFTSDKKDAYDTSLTKNEENFLWKEKNEIAQAITRAIIGTWATDK